MIWNMAKGKVHVDSRNSQNAEKHGGGVLISEIQWNLTGQKAKSQMQYSYRCQVSRPAT